MTDPFLTQLDAISVAGTSATQFLKKLGPIHSNWHVAHNSGVAQNGFLLFHWELIKRFKAVGVPAHFGGVTAFTTQELAAFHATYDVTAAVQKGNVASLESASRRTSEKRRRTKTVNE